jgi:hypothetical protein
MDHICSAGRGAGCRHSSQQVRIKWGYPLLPKNEGSPLPFGLKPY